MRRLCIFVHFLPERIGQVKATPNNEDEADEVAKRYALYTRWRKKKSLYKRFLHTVADGAAFAELFCKIKKNIMNAFSHE